MMHPTVLEIAHAIRTTRAAARISQRELGQRAGLTQAQISRFESGRVNLRLSSLVELARAIGLEVMLVPREGVPAAVEMGAEPAGGEDSPGGNGAREGGVNGGGKDDGPGGGGADNG